MINTHEAKTRLSEILSRLETTQETVRICRNGVPVADLVPVAKIKNPLKQHAALKNVEIFYDPVAPLLEDEWPEEDL